MTVYYACYGYLTEDDLLTGNETLKHPYVRNYEEAPLELVIDSISGIPFPDLESALHHAEVYAAGQGWVQDEVPEFYFDDRAAGLITDELALSEAGSWLDDDSYYELYLWVEDSIHDLEELAKLPNFGFQHLLDLLKAAQNEGFDVVIVR